MCKRALFLFRATVGPIQSEHPVAISIPPHRSLYRLRKLAHRISTTISISTLTQSPLPDPEARVQRLLPRRSPQPVDPPKRLFQRRVLSSQDPPDRRRRRFFFFSNHPPHLLENCWSRKKNKNPRTDGLVLRSLQRLRIVPF